jgi:hypothetical protein
MIPQLVSSYVSGLNLIDIDCSTVAIILATPERENLEDLAWLRPFLG